MEHSVIVHYPLCCCFIDLYYFFMFIYMHCVMAVPILVLLPLRSELFTSRNFMCRHVNVTRFLKGKCKVTLFLFYFPLFLWRWKMPEYLKIEAITKHMLHTFPKLTLRKWVTMTFHSKLCIMPFHMKELSFT